jgi:hypothetical protein
MKAQRIATAITIINLVILTLVFTQLRPAQAQQNPVAPVLRAHSLEIVDKSGKTRASITIQPPVTVAGKKYPETVLLRLIASNGKPMVKLGGTETGSGLTLIDGSDEGLLLRGDNEDTYIKITQNGKERVISTRPE